MFAVATGTVAILRGTTTDTYGDLADTAAVVATGVTASIIERSTFATTFGDARPQMVRRITCRLPAGTDIRAGDRLVNEQATITYMVDSLSTQDVVVHNGDVRVDLRRIE